MVTIPSFENGVNLDQLASKPADQDLHCFYLHDGSISIMR